MADKSSFTPDEWKLLLESVMMASIAITAAEPHGLWGLLQEKLCGWHRTGESNPADIKSKCIETLRRVAEVLDAKAPADASAFKTWLRQISQHVAEAAKEGGFLGIGGVAVSEAEKATLTEISTALKLPA